MALLILSRIFSDTKQRSATCGRRHSTKESTASADPLPGRPLPRGTHLVYTARDRATTLLLDRGGRDAEGQKS